MAKLVDALDLVPVPRGVRVRVSSSAPSTLYIKNINHIDLIEYFVLLAFINIPCNYKIRTQLRTTIFIIFPSLNLLLD